MKNVMDMTLDDIQCLTVDDIIKMTDEEKQYINNKVRSSFTDKEWMTAIKRLDTGIYDENGNLIGDKFDEEDAYEWDLCKGNEFSRVREDKD